MGVGARTLKRLCSSPNPVVLIGAHLQKYMTDLSNCKHIFLAGGTKLKRYPGAEYDAYLSFLILKSLMAGSLQVFLGFSSFYV